MTLQHDVGFGNIEKHSKYCWLFLLWLVVTLYQVPGGTYAAGQPTPPVSMHLSFAGTPLTLRNVNLLEKDCLG